MKIKKHMKKTLPLISTLVGIGILVGCSTAKQRVTRSTDPKTGIILEETSGKVFTMIQSQQTIDKLRASNGKTSQSIGMAGVEQQSDASKMVDAFTAMAKTLGEIYASVQTAGASKLVTNPNAVQIVNPPLNAVPVSIKNTPDGQLYCYFVNGVSNCFFVPNK